MPIPKLQRLGGVRDEFLYTIEWGEGIAHRTVRDYQAGRPSGFNDGILLRPGVGDSLVRLHSLLRPLLQRKWAEMVARINDLEESRLDSFLFGAERVSLEPVRDPLLELHDGRCFYCAGRLGLRGGRNVAIDHFVPWARHQENAIENLVPTHTECNSAKRDFLAARDHVERWRTRMLDHGVALAAIANAAGFEDAPSRTLSVARGIYLRLPRDARLWVQGKDLVPLGAAPLAPLFAPLEHDVA